MRAIWRRPARDDSGSALIIALIIMTVTVTLSLAAASEAVHGASTTQLDRNRIQAVSVAEGGIDFALSQLQGQDSLPCSGLTVPLSTAPVSGAASVTLTYYDSFPPSGSPDTTCSSGFPDGAPAAVEIQSSGKIGASTVGEQKMDALVQLSPYLSDAIYANALSVGNNVVISGQVGVGDNANIYVEGSPSTTVTCANNGDIHGSLYVHQGAVSLSNNCQVHGAVWADGSVSASNGSEVDGLISSTTGDISFSGSHAGGALAAGSVSPSCPSPAVFGSCAANATVGSPPSQSFPHVTWNANTSAQWQAAGFTLHDDSSLSCAAATSDLQSFDPTVKTVFVAPEGCQLSFGGNASLTTSADLAVFAPGGFTATNNFSWSSADGTTHTLYLIVPYTEPSNCSSSPTGTYNVYFKNNASFTNLNTLIYTPCNLEGKNNPVSTGQFYVGGDLQIKNNFSMTFQPEQVPGVTGSVSYNAAVAYERQVTN